MGNTEFNMSNHADIRELLTLAAAGALDAVEQRRLEDHLRRCPECRAELENWQRLTGALRAMPTPQTPPGLVERTRRQMEARTASRAHQPLARYALVWLTLFAWLSAFLTWPLFRFFSDRLAGLLDVSWTDAGLTRVWLGYIVVAWMASAIVAALLGKARQQEGRNV